MDFNLTEGQRMFQNLARDFAERTVRPRAKEIDRTSEWPADIVAGLAKIGLLGLPYPEQYSGLGADYMSFVLAVEQLSRVSMVTGGILAIATASEEALFRHGNEELKKKYLSPLCKGEYLCILAFTESTTGSDPRAIRSVAKQDGSDYLISGEKNFASVAPGSEIALIFAKDETEKVSAFIVPVKSKGFTIRKHWETMGLRGSGTCPIFLDSVRIPAENLVGQKGNGPNILMDAINLGQLGVCAEGVGVAQAALELSVNYAKERIVYGKPMSNLPTAQWELSEMATRIQAARLLTYETAFVKDQNKSIRKEVAMAKLFSSETAVYCTNLGMQIHGSYGYTKDFDIERFYRDAKITEIYEAVSEIQRMIIAQHITR